VHLADYIGLNEGTADIIPQRSLTIKRLHSVPVNTGSTSGSSAGEISPPCPVPHVHRPDLPLSLMRSITCIFDTASVMGVGTGVSVSTPAENSYT